MDFYHGVFCGQLVANSYAEFGMNQNPADANRIMHSQLEAPTDTPPGMPHQAGGTISISLSGTGEAELRCYWDGLKVGGNAFMPLEKAPWGDTFGQLTDKFGITWMVNITGSPQP